MDVYATFIVRMCICVVLILQYILLAKAEVKAIDFSD